MTSRQPLILHRLTQSYAVVHLPLSTELDLLQPLPGQLWSLTRSITEYSLVCTEEHLSNYDPSQIRCDGPWQAFYLQGPIPFSACGIIARLTNVLGAAQIGCFVLSTFDSDVVMVKADSAAQAIRAWQQADIVVAHGHSNLATNP
jgi:hypothetical protein